MKIETLTLTDQSLALAYAHWTPDQPNGQTVVAVHGLSRQKRDFDYIARHLAESGYTVLAVDAPGRGGSSWLADPEDYNLEVYAEAFAAFLATLGLPSVHWIGSSMGGLIALAMANHGHGDVLRSLTLVDVTHRPNPKACKRISDYVSEKVPVLQSVEQLIGITKFTLPLGEVSEEVWQHFSEHQLVETDKGFEFHFDPKIARRAKIELASTIDLTEGLAKVACPIALVAGAISDLCTQDEIADLKALRPDALVHLVPHAGHIPALNDTHSHDFITRFLSTAG